MLREMIEPGFWMGFWVGLGLAVVLATLVIALLLEWRINRTHRLRVAGLYPAPGETATERHFVTLLRAGHPRCAARLYRKTHKVGRKAAAAAIARMADTLRSS